MSSKILIKNVSYKQILNSVNMEIEEGIIALIGKNGSGKTTLLKSIFGLINYSGEIYINNTLITKSNLMDQTKNIGLYLGINNLSKNSVYSNIEEPLYNLGYDEKEIKKKIYSISKKFGIENILYKNISQISYSQKKVVSFIKSVIHDPSIILIDDIFSSLDINYKNKIINYLNQLKKKSKIILITTNDSENLNISDKIVVLKDGKLTNIEEIKYESVLLKNNMKVPFLIDLISKLKSYELIKKDYNNLDEVVDAIWK